tara:strand:- start:2038 stop:3030 length:993 start_codon:yes stop_codon:yes gene_type:complete
MNILVTGCFGFIGYNFLNYIKNYFPNDFNLIGVDSLISNTSKLNQIEFNKFENFEFYRLDINDIDTLKKKDFELIINFAAESHVDNSISDPNKFIKSNVMGTNELLKFALKNEVQNFIHISTDEVYGSNKSGFSLESDNLDPSSPYSASKASAEMICKAYIKTYDMKIKMCRPANNYGNYQQPEKLIPYTIANLLSGKNIELYGDGKNIRHWLHVEDTCLAILTVMNEGKDNSIYNIGSGEYFNNLDIANKILGALELDSNRITFVEDRPGHDFRYAVNFENLKDIGFKPQKSVDNEISNIVEWYKVNKSWWEEDYLKVLENRLKRTQLN